MELIFMKSEDSETSELHRFRMHLTEKLNWKDPKNMASSNLSLYYTWQKYKTRIQQQ